MVFDLDNAFPRLMVLEVHDYGFSEQCTAAIQLMTAPRIVKALYLTNMGRHTDLKPLYYPALLSIRILAEEDERKSSK